MVCPVLCVPSRELIRCLKWYMDRSAEVVKQDHIQEAMRVGEHAPLEDVPVLLTIDTGQCFELGVLKMSLTMSVT